MEVTKVFKACVKAAKMRRQDGGRSSDDILSKKTRREKSDENCFNNKAIEVVRCAFIIISFLTL